ncbi:MAG: sugar phosphate isomerase/epimerase family protein [Candidatus Latescibacterota bacterium]
MKLATCNEYFEGWKIEEVFEYAAQVGYQGVEIAPFALAPSVAEIGGERRRQIRQAASQAGVEIVGLHWLLVSPPGLYVDHPDSAIRRATQDYFKALIRFCGELGGEVMILGSPKQRSVQPGWDYGETWQRARETFEACLPLAQECGVYLCLEPLSPEQTNFVTTAEEARRMVAQIGHPHFRTMVDVCSGSTEARPVAQLLRDSGPHLFHVHVNDANKRGPGFGQTDFVPILRALKELDYRRYVSLEVFDFTPDPRTIAARSLGYLQGILAAL